MSDEEVFKRIKEQKQFDVVLAHYNPKLSPVLALDASPHCVGAIIRRLFADRAENLIQYGL